MLKFYHEDLECAQLYNQSNSFPLLNKEQIAAIRKKGNELRKSYHKNWIVHNSMSVLLIIVLFSIDYSILVFLPELLALILAEKWNLILLSMLICGVFHGILMYNIGIYGIHEGSSHRLIIQERGFFTRILGFLANNMVRVFFADPNYYSEGHKLHHTNFATEKDGSFLNFVNPVRFLISTLPFAGVLPFSDFKVHRGSRHTKSLIITDIITSMYIGIFLFILTPKYGLIYGLVVLVIIGPWFAFVLDRIRESTEHNLMPLNPDNGTRDIGVGFWGLLIGGGPWGQPCHMSHHLVGGIPWYQQIQIHFFIKKILSPEQKNNFIPANFSGYPKILIRSFTHGIKYRKKIQRANFNQKPEF